MVKSATVNYETIVWRYEAADAAASTLSSLKLQRALVALAPVRGRVLEVGCGSGEMVTAVAAQRPDLQVHGCELSRSALDTARRQLPSGSFVVSDIGHLPYQDKIFAGILVLDVLEHIADVSIALKELYRVIQPTGILHCHIPCEGQPGTLHWLLWKLGFMHDLKERYIGHIQRFTLAGAVELLRTQGFRVVRQRFCYHPFGQAMDNAVFIRKHLRGERGDVSAELAEDVPRTGRGWIRAIDAIAYRESSWLGRIPVAMGLDVTAVAVPRTP